MNGFAWLIVATCAALSLFFAACNYALRTFNHLRIEEELARRNRRGELGPLLGRVGRLILTTATLRIASNVVLILMLARLLTVGARGHWTIHLALAGAVAFSVIMVFSVAVPNAWAKYAGEPLLVRTLPMLQALGRLLAPVTWLLHQLDELVRRLAGAPRVSEDAEHVERQILSAVTEGAREGVVAPEEKQMIESVLEFSDTRADQIMTPRTDIVAVDVASDLNTVLETIHTAGHSRIPVYEGSLDNIVGLLYAKDLLWQIGRQAAAQGTEQPPAGAAPRTESRAISLDLRQVMRPPLFVPESRSVGDLLNDMRRAKVHLVVVLDEFGGTAGLVTVEDILEEIVGDIADEHEQPAPSMIRKIDERTFELDGRVHVDDLNDQLDLSLPEQEDYDTVSGLVISQLGRIPKAGEQVRRDNVVLTVTHAEPRKINRLRLEILAPESPVDQLD